MREFGWSYMDAIVWMLMFFGFLFIVAFVVVLFNLARDEFRTWRRKLTVAKRANSAW
jgi:hypothetical protein